MRLPPTKIEELRNILIDANLYQPRNEPLIKLAVQTHCLIDRAEKELGAHQLTLKETGSRGQDKYSIHPIVPQLVELYAKESRILAYLGLGNKPVDGELKKDERSLLENLMQM